MRLDRVYIDGFKNLKQVMVDFDERCLTTVIIGQNGAGKSNLIEAITNVFRWVDLRRNEPRFHYQIDYRIDGTKVCLSNLPDRVAISVNGQEVKRADFERRKTEWFPEKSQQGAESQTGRYRVSFAAGPFSRAMVRQGRQG